MSCAARAKRLLALAAPLAALLAAVAADPASSSSAPVRARAAGSVLHSRQLWATINVCNPTDQPDYIGIRGSMPGDGRPHDSMYMSFRLQYMNSSTKHWADLSGTTPSFASVGSGPARQGGQSFQLMPVAGRPAIVLRGLVEFQWRRGKRVLMSAKRPTTPGHVSVAGSDPQGFSAATCQIG